MQKSMDTGSLPTKPAPASTRRKSIVIFSLLVLLVSNGCRSHRQTVETIALSQRHQLQSIQLDDTMWQSLHGRIGRITIHKMKEKEGIDTTQNFISIVGVELTLDKHSKTESKILSNQEDTVFFNRIEVTENVAKTTNSESDKKSNGFLTGLLFSLAVIGIMFIIRILRNKW